LRSKTVDELAEGLLSRFGSPYDQMFGLLRAQARALTLDEYLALGLPQIKLTDDEPILYEHVVWRNGIMYAKYGGITMALVPVPMSADLNLVRLIMPELVEPVTTAPPGTTVGCGPGRFLSTSGHLVRLLFPSAPSSSSS
jgi:hypothetical protein